MSCKFRWQFGPIPKHNKIISYQIPFNLSLIFNKKLISIKWNINLSFLTSLLCINNNFCLITTRYLDSIILCAGLALKLIEANSPILIPESLKSKTTKDRTILKVAFLFNIVLFYYFALDFMVYLINTYNIY